MSKAPRTRHLKPGNKNLTRVRRPPLQARVGSAAALVLGEAAGDLVHNVLEGMRRGSIPATAGRLVLERLLPPARPIRLDLPMINKVEDLRRAQDIIIEAVNDGRITPGEARELQEVALQALRAGREAEPPHRPQPLMDARLDLKIVAGATALGMAWPDGEPEEIGRMRLVLEAAEGTDREASAEFDHAPRSRRISWSSKFDPTDD